MTRGASPDGDQYVALRAEPSVPLSQAKPLIPYAGDWQFTGGETPDLPRHALIWALGRYGDVYGPLPFEMFAEEAWHGNMLNASHDLAAWAECHSEFRDVIPFQLRPDLTESISKLISLEYQAGIPVRQTAKRVIELIRTADRAKSE